MDRESNSGKQVYRVQKYIGSTTYKHTDICIAEGLKTQNPDKDDRRYPNPLPIEYDGSAKIIVIHDSGNGFRNEKVVWQKALEKKLSPEDEKPIVIYNMYPPLFEGELWSYINQKNSEGKLKKLIFIINADDLRKFGVNISSPLSWEKTLSDFLLELRNNKKLKKVNDKLEQIKSFPDLIIRFGVEGAIHYTWNPSSPKTILYFDPLSVEGEFWDYKKLGTMRGITLVFVSMIASILALQRNNEFDKTLETAIKEALLKTRELLKKGHGKEPVFLDEICKELFTVEPNEKESHDKKIECNIANVSVPVSNFNHPRPDLDWTIFQVNTKTETTRIEYVAKNIVTDGWYKLNSFPVGRFGKLITIDRKEIESFRSIMSIMEEYIGSEKTSRPLSIAVFGSPGSGKSFGITEVAKNIDPEIVFKMDFNVSQFTSVEDLVNAFHRIRDLSLRGKVPLVFFDEFDCPFGDQKLGWIRYFLAPMQDGEFMDCGFMHPIGKSIFVFAGGIFTKFEEFRENINSNEKCTDFLSRLRGYVNILGPNRDVGCKEKADSKDEAHIIRRAIILRSLIEEKVPNILDNSDVDINIHSRHANIDSNLLNALINIEKYKHGVRSMEAVIEMSMITGKKSWVKAYLPSKDQLDLHVDGSEFYNLLYE